LLEETRIDHSSKRSFCFGTMQATGTECDKWGSPHVRKKRQIFQQILKNK